MRMAMAPISGFWRVSWAANPMNNVSQIHTRDLASKARDKPASNKQTNKLYQPVPNASTLFGNLIQTCARKPVHGCQLQRGRISISLSSICSFILLSMYLSIDLSMKLPTSIDILIHQSIHPCIYLSSYLAIYLDSSVYISF